MKVKKRIWTQGKQVAKYCYKDILDAAEMSYNNINAEKLWNAPEVTTPAEKKDEAIKEKRKNPCINSKIGAAREQNFEWRP